MPRNAFTLPELLLVLVLTALVTALGAPSLLHVTDRRMVESAAQQIVYAHREARMTAFTTQRTALLRIAADSIELRLTNGGPDTILAWRRPGPRSFGVTVTGNAHTFRFIPSGYTIGASNASYTLVRGAAKRKVIIARLGRVRVE